MKLVPSFPAVDLDGTPHPRCEHHSRPDDRQRAIITAVGEGIIAAGLPDIPACVGTIVETTWGCTGNKRMKTRLVYLACVEVMLRRHPQSMFYLPSLEYLAWKLGEDDEYRYDGTAMCLRDFVTADGVRWTADPGDTLPGFSFVLEQVSPNTGLVQRVDGTGVQFVG